jgi:hypothetical protein
VPATRPTAAAPRARRTRQPPAVAGKAPMTSRRHALAVRPLADCEPPPDEMVEDAEDAERPLLEHRLRATAGAMPAPASSAPAGTPGAPAERHPARGDAASARAAREVTRLVAMLIEVLDGRRPASQLRDMLSEQVYAALQTRVRTTRPGRARRLRSIHPCRPAPGVLELCATFGTPHRTFAAALRLEYRAGRWRCTALRVL